MPFKCRQAQHRATLVAHVTAAMYPLTARPADDNIYEKEILGLRVGSLPRALAGHCGWCVVHRAWVDWLYAAHT